MKELANRLDSEGRIEFDESGGIWVVLTGPEVRRIGVSSGNAAADESAPELACELLMARVGAELKSSPKNREMLPEFEADWRLLQNVHRNLYDRVLVKTMPDEIALTALSQFASTR